MRVRERREELEMSQRELANALGVSAAVLSRWESGKQPVPEGRYEQIAAALRLEVPALLGDARYARPSEMEAWRDLVFDEQTISPEAQLILLWISRKSRTVDGVAAYIGSPRHAARLVRNLTEDEVVKAWPDVLASPYVEGDAVNEGFLRFTFPTQH